MNQKWQIPHVNKQEQDDLVVYNEATPLLGVLGLDLKMAVSTLPRRAFHLSHSRGKVTYIISHACLLMPPFSLPLHID